MTDEKRDFILQVLQEYYNVSDDCINFAVGTYGYNDDTIFNLLYYFTGFRSYEQLEDDFKC